SRLPALLADVVSHVLGLFGVHVGDHDLCSLLGKYLGRGPSHAAGGSGHEHDEAAYRSAERGIGSHWLSPVALKNSYGYMIAGRDDAPKPLFLQPARHLDHFAR